MGRVGWIGLAVGLLAACDKEEPGAASLQTDDVSKLRIARVDESTVSVLATAGAVDEGTPVHVENVTAGEAADTVGLEDGGFTVSLGGAVDHVFSVRSEGDATFMIAADGEGGDVALAWGVGFESAAGCELRGWSGIVEEREGSARERCSARASIVGEQELLEGPVGDVDLRRDTRLAATLAVVGVGADAPELTIELVDLLGETHAFDVAPPSAGVFETIELVIGQVLPDVAGRTIEEMRLRAPAGSALDVADITAVPIDVPPF